jgi:RNA polymerase sigma-70 factor (ECF subfamily)
MAAYPTTADPDEAALLAAARSGDERAFGLLVEGRRAELQAHCYRMLGSLHDAEDALQDTLLRAWRGLRGFDGRSSLRTWLYRIATNVCLDTIARRTNRVLPVDYGPAADPHAGPGEPVGASVWVEPYPDSLLGVEAGHSTPEARYELRESVELAFVAALQHLPGRQRAVLVLREVLGFSAREVAESLHTSVASVNSALQRARRTIGQRLPARSQQALLRERGEDDLQDLVRRFVEALERGDVKAIVALLTDDVVFEMPPYPRWYRGRDDVAESWLLPDDGSAERLRFLPAQANGQLALGAYALDAASGSYLPVALDVLTLDERGITGITAFRAPELFARFGLPDRLSA